MNELFSTNNYIGATGEYPIYEYIDTTSNIQVSLIINTSNDLISQIINTSNNLASQILDTSNYIMNRFLPTSNLIYTNATNTIIRSDNEILFNTYNMSKVANDGTLQVYHNLDVTLPTRAAGWWNVHDELVNCKRDEIGLRFDVTNLQAATGISPEQLKNAVTNGNAYLATSTALSTGLGLGSYIYASSLLNAMEFDRKSSNTLQYLSGDQASSLNSMINSNQSLFICALSNLALSTGFITCNQFNANYLNNIALPAGYITSN